MAKATRNLLTALVILIAVSGVLPSRAHAAGQRVTLGWGSIDAVYGPWFYAQENGYFQKRGLDTTLVFFDSGTKAVQALLGGSVDICAADGTGIINARLGGIDIRFVGVTLGVLSGKIIVAKDITKPAQLKGKKWGISSFGSEAQMAEQLALKAFGLSESDVTTVQLGNAGNRFAALETGQIQASSFASPISATVEAAGYNVLAELPDLAPDYLSVGPAVLTSTARDRRAMVKSFLEAIGEATAAYKRDREGAIAAIRKYTKANEHDAATAWEYYSPLHPANLRPTSKSVQFILDRSSDPKAKTMTPGDFLDLSILDELDREGFFKAP